MIKSLGLLGVVLAAAIGFGTVGGEASQDAVCCCGESCDCASCECSADGCKNCEGCDCEGGSCDAGCCDK